MRYIDPFYHIQRVQSLDYIISQILKPDEDETYLLLHDDGSTPLRTSNYILHGLEAACEALARKPVGWFTLVDSKTPSSVVAFPGYGQLTITPSRIRFGQDFGEGFIHTLEYDPRFSEPRHFTGFEQPLPDSIKTYTTSIPAQEVLDRLIPSISDEETLKLLPKAS